MGNTMARIAVSRTINNMKHKQTEHVPIMTVYLGLGSNLGDRRQQITDARQLLRKHAQIEETQTSQLFETDPVGPVKPQPRYINAVVEITTTLTVQNLLREIHAIERLLNRDRSADAIRWGPRTIDIDILLYSDLILDESELTIPHPRMHERLFVLKPLSEIAPDAIHPILGLTIQELLALLNH